MGAQGHPSGPADSMPQGPAPTAPTHTSKTGGPPWVPPVNNQNKDHQDPLECNGTTNGSTGAHAESGKGPGPTKGKNRTLQPCPGTSSGTGSTTQPAGSSKNTVVCSACGGSGHWSKNCPCYNFCDVCRVTTHSTHMCRASKCGNATARSLVCIYCGKTNHGSTYYRYRLRDNCEEPQNTPDALRTGTIGENSALAARNQTGSAPHNNNKVPFSLIQMVEARINPIEVNQDPNLGVSMMEVNKDLNRESTPVLLSEANKWLLILVFLLGDSNMLILMKVSTGDILPPTFPSPGFNNTMASDAVGRSIIQLAENQSRSLNFILVGQQSQMVAYKEMTCSNQAREDDALFAGIQVYDERRPLML